MKAREGVHKKLLQLKFLTCPYLKGENRWELFY